MTHAKPDKKFPPIKEELRDPLVETLTARAEELVRQNEIYKKLVLLYWKENRELRERLDFFHVSGALTTATISWREGELV